MLCYSSFFRARCFQAAAAAARAAAPPKPVDPDALTAGEQAGIRHLATTARAWTEGEIRLYYIALKRHGMSGFREGGGEEGASEGERAKGSEREREGEGEGEGEGGGGGEGEGEGV